MCQASAWTISGLIIYGQGQFSSFQWLSRIQLFVTPWTAALQASLSITNSRSPPKPMSIESMMPSNHLILCHPLLLLPPIPPSIRVFPNESSLCMKWPKDWSFSFSIIPSKEHQRIPSKEGDQSWVFIGRTNVEAETPIFCHMMWRTDSLEKTLMLGKIEGGRRRGRQRIR